MEDGLLSLKWNNHKATFFHILGEVRGKQTYTDATLACEGKFYPVHKLVMSTCSDYFAEIFEKTPCKNPVVVLKDIKKTDLDALLDYMYIGEVDVRQNALPGLIKAAECLRIKGLAVPDEDPTKVQKKGPNNVPEKREDSPPAKRKRRESGEKGRSFHISSPLLQSSLLSVPSHAPSQQSSVPESRVPSQSMPPPSGSIHPESKLGSLLQVSSVRSSSHESSSSSQRTYEAPQVLPVEEIKVEVVEASDSVNKDVHLDKGRSDEGGGGGGAGVGGGSSDLGVEEDTSRDYEYHSDVVEKEEHDQVEQMDSYGADQIPGPSGLQGGQPLMAWGEEGEGAFPHNLFGNEDPGSQQAKSHWGKAYTITTKEKEYTCKFCEYKTNYSSNITKHVRIHTGEKPFKCPLCSYSASSKVNLNRHFRIHTGEKPFKCQYPNCDFAANVSSGLKQHMIVHMRDELLMPNYDEDFPHIFTP